MAAASNMWLDPISHVWDMAIEQFVLDPISHVWDMAIEQFVTRTIKSVPITEVSD